MAQNGDATKLGSRLPLTRSAASQEGKSVAGCLLMTGTDLPKAVSVWSSDLALSSPTRNTRTYDRAPVPGPCLLQPVPRLWEALRTYGPSALCKADMKLQPRVPDLGLNKTARPQRPLHGRVYQGGHGSHLPESVSRYLENCSA
jgi:hypothetical protein